MPTTRFVLARALGAIGLIAGVVALAQAQPAFADAPRLTAKSPFTCGQVWFARTYVGHPRYAIDWNLPGGGEADYGQPVLAGAPGVASVTSEKGYGTTVRVDHGNGWTTLYGHLSAVDVVTGQTVAPDTVVGRVGHTGRADGSHLHQEQLLNGVRQPIEVDGVAIVASFSSRGASYQSANCPAPRTRSWSSWGRSGWRSPLRRPLP